MTDLFVEEFEQIIDFPTQGSNILDLVFLRGDIVVLKNKSSCTSAEDRPLSRICVSVSQ